MKKIGIGIGIFFGILIIFWSVTVTQKSDLSTVDVVMKQNDKGNLILLVTNASPTINLLDVTLYIDDNLVLKGNFDNREVDVDQHPVKMFKFLLSNGTHKISVESANGHAKLGQEFDINGVRYLLLSYEHVPNFTAKNFIAQNFTLRISSEPFYFE